MTPLGRWSVAIAGAIAAGTISAAVLTRSKTPISRVALIGDSYAAGLGPELAQLISPFSYEGRVGSGGSTWANNLPAWLAALRPGLVLVSLGVNDNPPAAAQYQSIVRELHGLGARVVWIEPPAAVETPSRAAIAALGVPTVPAPNAPLAVDGLHPKSYTSWARDIAQVISHA